MNSDHIRVFLIEDNDNDAVLIRRFLTSSQNPHIDVEVADRLLPALKRLGSEKYDVILSDLSLPDSWGLETFVKVHSASPAVPIIILTGLDDEAAALEAVHLGAQDYLVKSQINSRNLIRVIRYSIERQMLLVQLENSLKEINILQGLLPICASCKKICDDKGSWTQLESYISEHSQALFSHGLCPDCATKTRDNFHKFKQDRNIA
ncbi:MAG TPA: response regulator [Nitrospirota bacterium]|nr:response regulator [Nitrospirota bacterium]